MTLTTSRLISALVALVAAATVAGCSCGGDDYYCDDTGCYFCDGFGCRDAEAPPQAACTGDWQCGAGQVCTEDGCASRCSLDEQCPDGTVCIDSGFCMPPGSAEPLLRPGACESNADCGDGGLCQDGMCMADPNLPDDGDDSPVDDTPIDDTPIDDTPIDDTPIDETPIDETPVGPPPQCTLQSDCGIGWDCIDAICKLGCQTDEQCGPGCTCDADGWCAGSGYDQ